MFPLKLCCARIVASNSESLEPGVFPVAPAVAHLTPNLDVRAHFRPTPPAAFLRILSLLIQRWLFVLAPHMRDQCFDSLGRVRSRLFSDGCKDLRPATGVARLPFTKARSGSALRHAMPVFAYFSGSLVLVPKHSVNDASIPHPS